MSIFSVAHEDIVKKALLEDLERGQDLTSQTLIPYGHMARCFMRSRDKGVIAGTEIAKMAFAIVCEQIQITCHVKDGSEVNEGDNIISIEGPAQSVLAAERTVLNFMSHMSGIATRTRQYVDAVAGTKAAITCTRKTLPGLRAVQKYAVRMGGGKNHRFGLDDGILIKDNHIALCGGVGAAIEKARNHAGHMVKIEIEVDTLGQLEEALAHKIDAVLLDNMPPAQLRQAIDMIGGRALAEASGGITLDTVAEIAQAGVDIISIGALTHSVTALDIGLDIDPA